ncbi:MAG: hypothetical protein R2712_20650 [Vicinamibacterales bacterium]
MPRGVQSATAEQLLADEAALASTMGFTGRDRLLAMVPMSHFYGFNYTRAVRAGSRAAALIAPADSGPLAPIDAARRFFGDHRADGACLHPCTAAPVGAPALAGQPAPRDHRRRRPARRPRDRLPPPVRTAGARLLPSECGGICYDRDGDAAERGTVGMPVDGVRVTLAPIDDGGDEGLVTAACRPSGAATPHSRGPSVERRVRDQRRRVARRPAGAPPARGRASSTCGRKVDPAEVERVLLALAGIDDAVVIPDDDLDHGDVTVRAVVAVPGGGVDYEQVWRWCQVRLADHSAAAHRLRPRDPEDRAGKVDRAALDALAYARREPRPADA